MSEEPVAFLYRVDTPDGEAWMTDHGLVEAVGTTQRRRERERREAATRAATEREEEAAQAAADRAERIARALEKLAGPGEAPPGGLGLTRAVVVAKVAQLHAESGVWPTQPATAYALEGDGFAGSERRIRQVQGPGGWKGIRADAERQ